MTTVFFYLLKIYHLLGFSNVLQLKVGYGDLTPITGLGKLFASLCALSGIIIIAMPVGLLANNFSILYKESKDKNKYKDKVKPIKTKSSIFCFDNKVMQKVSDGKI